MIAITYVPLFVTILFRGMPGIWKSRHRLILCWLVFLQALYRASTMGSRQLVVITDHARYHHARLHRNWREEHANRFVLDSLPPYSPDLNPSERVWKLTRRQCLHNRYFPLRSEATDCVEAQFAQWASGNVSLRRLCAIT